MKKSRLALLTLVLSAMSLVACGDEQEQGGGAADTTKCTHEYGEYVQTKAPTELQKGESTATCSKCGKKKTKDIDALGFLHTVTIKDASGATISSEQIRSIKKITKPANPTAPAGQVFYGWKNVKNGGQIWDFENDVLGLVAADVELVPCFIPAGTNPQYLEAELVPAITEGEGGMHGATYSGGADGKQFIREDCEYEYGSTCEIDAFKYYRDPTTLNYIVSDTAPAGATLNTIDPKGINSGYFVHYNYNKGNTFTWNITSSAAVSDVVIFARFSAEYGVIDETTNDRISSFSQTSFPISVNGVAQQYGTITMHNIPEVGKFLPFQDYFIAASVSLNAGANVITMKVDNEDTVNGTIASTSPVIDCLKLYTSATLTWDEAKLTNLIK